MDDRLCPKRQVIEGKSKLHSSTRLLHLITELFTGTMSPVGFIIELIYCFGCFRFLLALSFSLDFWVKYALE